MKAPPSAVRRLFQLVVTPVAGSWPSLRTKAPPPENQDRSFFAFSFVCLSIHLCRMDLPEPPRILRQARCSPRLCPNNFHTGPPNVTPGFCSFTFSLPSCSVPKVSSLAPAPSAPTPTRQTLFLFSLSLYLRPPRCHSNRAVIVLSLDQSQPVLYLPRTVRYYLSSSSPLCYNLAALLALTCSLSLFVLFRDTRIPPLTTILALFFSSFRFSVSLLPELGAR